MSGEPFSVAGGMESRPWLEDCRNELGLAMVDGFQHLVTVPELGGQRGGPRSSSGHSSRPSVETFMRMSTLALKPQVTQHWVQEVVPKGPNPGQDPQVAVCP